MKLCNFILFLCMAVMVYDLKAQITTTHTYNPRGELIQTTYSNGIQITYAYDQLGNRMIMEVVQTMPLYNLQFDTLTTVTDTLASSGNAFLTATIKNTGPSVVPNTILEYWWSADTVWDQQMDVKVFSQLQNNVPGNNAIPIASNFPIPSNQTNGTYYLIGVIDATNLAAELNENDNTYWIKIVVDNSYTGTPPVANFTAFPTLTSPNGTVHFSDNSTNSPLAWEWSFPGGTPATSTQQHPSVSYAVQGTYSATLIAINADGNDTLTKAYYVSVTAPPANPPVAAFTANDTTIMAGQSVLFQDQSTNIPITWEWYFPGGTPATSTLASPQVHYTLPGHYDVTLVAGNAMGQDTLTRSQYIQVGSALSNIIDTQYLYLETGWNLISFYVHPPDSMIPVVFQNIDTCLLAMRDMLHTYDVAYPLSSNSLQHITDGSGYWVKVQQPCTLEVSGLVIDRYLQPIELKAGWNLVAFYDWQAVAIQDALNSIQNDIEQIKHTQTVHTPSLPAQWQTLPELEPGKGYLIKVKSDVTLWYNY